MVKIMADKSVRNEILPCFDSDKSLSIHEIQSRLSEQVPERTLRRWLVAEVNKGQLIRTGNKRSTRYQKNFQNQSRPVFKFLQDKSELQQTQILKQIRDFWTHTSTALEGNTLTLGDTHFLLEEGLTVSGKPLKDHQEVVGHAKAIEIMYQSLSQPVTEALCFKLHQAIQTENVNDIYKPYGDWKKEVNGTYTVDSNNQQVYLEYALPEDVPKLMDEIMQTINSANQVSLQQAHVWYARIHVGIVHIHPFWDGNGRIARLLANVPLLKSGLPPIVIPQEKRREYIQLLADYEIAVGKIDISTGVWPQPDLLKAFESFCLQCYQDTRRVLRG